MLALDARDDPVADHLRDAMDPIWYSLREEDRAQLDAGVTLAPRATLAQGVEPNLTQRADAAAVPLGPLPGREPERPKFLTGSLEGRPRGAADRRPTETWAVIAGLPFAT
ncbi:MAG TPA: hypothetical protein VGQ83_09735 [Polyangia bacterium]|jgi:hypothetical protein